MTKDELIKFIEDDITVSGSVNLQFNEAEISRIIDMCKRQVHREWRDAVELQMAILSPKAFRTQEFRQSRTIQLPDCVFGIDEFREIKDGSRLFGINDPDLSLERVMASDLWLSPFSSDVITTRTISYSWFDLARSFTLIDIQFKFNINTHKIQIIGHDPLAPVLIRAFVAIEDSALFDDYWFQTLCCATCKIRANRVLKQFEFTAVGGVQISSLLKEEGDKQLEEVKDWRDKNEQPDYFLEFN